MYRLFLETPLGFAPQAGVLLAVLVQLPLRRWGTAVAVAVPVQAGLAIAGLGGGPWWALWAATVVGPVAAACFFRPGEGRDPLVPVSSLVWFLGAVAIGTGFAALIYVPVNTPRQWLVATLSVGVGMLVAPPVLLSWHGAASRPRRPVELLLLSVAVLASSVLIFGTAIELVEVTLPYLALPPVMWASLRFGMRGASRSTFLVAAVALIFTDLARGPFVAALGERLSAVTFAQLFIVVTAASAYLLAAMVDDLHDREEVEDKLRQLAYSDALTGLPNRAHLAAVLEDLAVSGHGVALLICDVDDFKVVNDGLGHPSGDQMLVAIAGRIRSCLRAGDTLARLSGDEFVVVLPGVTDSAADRVAWRILRQVAVELPLGDRGELRPSVSIGVACRRGPFDVEAVLADADAALYRAKERGKSRVSHFDEDLRRLVEDRLLIVTDFAPALRTGEVHWLFQPELDVHTGELFGLESLCRWNHPVSGAISPDRFVRVLESTGHANRLFDAALDASTRAQREIRHRSGFVPAVSVNVSPTLLSDPGLAARVASVMERDSVPPRSLFLEVTESALATPRATRTLEELKQTGVRLAIDDFGTGWSSMGRLASFQWDVLKIDRSFVARLGVDAHMTHVVEAIVAMAHSLGTLVAAEGVETEEQLRLVSELGCDVVQGWYFSRAVPAHEAAAWLDSRGTWTGVVG